MTGNPELGAMTLRTMATACVKVYGEQSEYALAALSQLGRAYKDAGDYENSLRVQRRCLDGFTSTLGPEHPSSQLVMMNLAELLHQMGHDEEALILARSVLDFKVQLGNQDHAESTRVKKLLSDIESGDTSS